MKISLLFSLCHRFVQFVYVCFFHPHKEFDMQKCALIKLIGNILLLVKILHVFGMYAFEVLGFFTIYFTISLFFTHTELCQIVEYAQPHDNNKKSQILALNRMIFAV